MSLRLPRAAMAVQRDPGFARVADLVPDAARRILHLGCGAGVAALLLKLRRPDRHVTGVVGDPMLAQQAAAHCDDILAPEHTALLPPRSFDCILASDLLDRALDPAAALDAALRLLVPGGHLVVEAACAAHALAVAAATRHQPDSRAGFTRRSLIDLLQQRGCELTALRLDLERSVPDRLMPFVQQAGLGMEQLEESLTPRFFAICIYAEPAEQIPVCSVIVRPVASVAGTLAALRGEAERLAIQTIVAEGTEAADLNRSAERARGRYLAFIDAGTQPQSGWLWALIRTAQTTAGAGIVGSVLSDETGGRWCGFGIGANDLPYRHHPFALRDEGAGSGADAAGAMTPRDSAVSVAAVSVNGMLIERSRFLFAGGFDERLAGELFDVDLCLRMQTHGRTAVCCPSSTLQAGGRIDASESDPAAKRYFADKWSPALESAFIERSPIARPPGTDLRSRVSGQATLLWSGYVFGPSGYAESTRNFLTALDRAGVQSLANPYATSHPSSLDETVDLDPLIADRAPSSFVSIVARPAIFFRRHDHERIAIGRTMNETDLIPTGWVSRCNQMDQIWVPSRFCFDSFVRSGVDRERVFVIPETIDERTHGAHVEPMAIENATGFVFLSVFVMGPRKGWKTLLRAYLDEFRNAEDVTLLLRVSPSQQSPLTDLAAFLAEHLGGNPAKGPRVVLCPATIDAATMPRLYRSVDAFVLPSRGEGWGRPYMEAMASGLPTIGTGWSGNTDFMDADNSYLLDYELVPHDDPSLPVHFHTPENTLWAEPSLEHLRKLMRTVFEDRGAAARRGALARESVLDRFRHDKVAAMVVERLEQSGVDVARTGSRASQRPVPTCSVIAVARDGAESIRACIEALDASPPKLSWELVVVAAGGLDDVAAISRCATDTRIVRVAGDLSDEAARNAGAAEARGDHLVFVDEGTRPQPGWLDALMEARRARSGTGIVGSMLMAEDGSILHAGLVFGPELLPYPLYRGMPSSSPQAGRDRPLRAVAATGMLVARKTYQALGGFEETLSGSYADADLCQRVREVGLDVVYCARSVLVHAGLAGPGPRIDHEHALTFLETWAPSMARDDAARCDEDGTDVLAVRAGIWPMPPRGRTPSSRPPAVLWSAPVFDRSGYANEARDYVLALDEAGVDVFVNPHPWQHVASDLPEAEVARITELARAELPRSFVHVILHQAIRFARHPQALANIGRTMFETDSLPRDRVERCNAMDEVWVPSRFNVETFAAAGVDPGRLVVIPEAIDAELYARRMQALEIPDASGFVFLSVFAWSVRKGWDVLLRAFVEEFAGNEDVTLVLAISTSAVSVPVDPAPSIVTYLRETLQRDPASTARIVVLPLALSPRKMPALYAAADAFVLPSRGEGWGRPYMEAMACGLPTIGTGWSGNTEFMNAGNSYLIEHELVELPEDGWARPGLFRGQRWASPSVTHLRSLMREVFTNRQAAARVGERARAEVLERYGRRKVASMMKDRIDALIR